MKKTRIVVDRDVQVPMRDGCMLATDVYRRDDDDPKPTIIMRTPYGRSTGFHVTATVINPLVAADQGFAVVIQEVRGRFNSGGTFAPFVTEGDDGYDTVEWAAQQPWSTGAVGLVGPSADGISALQAAIAAPPHLRAVLTHGTGSNYHDGWAYSGGAFELGFNLFWASKLAINAIARMPAGRDRSRFEAGLEAFSADPRAALETLPVVDALPFADDIAPYWREWLENPEYEPYWEPIDVVAQATRITVPIFHVASWYDIMLKSHLDLQRELQRHPNPLVRDGSRLHIGPWDHEAYLSLRTASAGIKTFGNSVADGVASMTDLTLGWFRHWLADEPRIDALAEPIRYFVTGANEWRTSKEWPPAHRQTPFYLDSDGRANTLKGDGRLISNLPASNQRDGFTYDPGNPVPTCGGRTLNPDYGPGGIQDQTSIETRDDVLVYTGDVLAEALQVEGPVSVTLFATTSAPDTDFTAKLVDVEPSGLCANIAEGITRLRYRHGGPPDFPEPGTVVELTIDLWAVAHTFAAGHCIRLEISSSNFPRFDRNLNVRKSPALATFDEAQVADQTALHGPDHPSCMTLPVVKIR